MPQLSSARHDGCAAQSDEAVAAVWRLLDCIYARFGEDLSPQLLREVEIVLVQGVLGVVPASDHAAAAKDTTRPRGSRAPKVRIPDQLSGGTEKDRHVGGLEGPALVDLFRALPQNPIRLGQPWIRGGSKHPPGGDVMRRQRFLPVLARRPLRALEDGRPRSGEGVRVHEAAAADAGPGADEDVGQQRQSQNAVAEELRHPQETPYLPVGVSKVFGPEALARFEHGDSITLLGKAQCGDRATEPRADDQNVIFVDGLQRYLGLGFIG